MQVLNYFRARFCNSSYAALDLIRNNKKYSSMAEKIVSVKQSNACRDLIVSHSDEWRQSELRYKLNKYDGILKQLLAIRIYNDRADRWCNTICCTRL